jgi:hypothetical protein
MKQSPRFVAAGILVVFVAAGCGVQSPTSPGGATGPGQTDGSSGKSNRERTVQVDAGVELSLNVLVLKLTVWGVARNADQLVIEAYDWASRKLRYLLNGEPRDQTLTPEQADDLVKEAKKKGAQ